LNEFDRLLTQCDLPRKHRRRLRRHLLSRLVCLGRHSITGLLTASGSQFKDWTADYRFYACRRSRPQRIFDVLRRQILQDHPSGRVVVAIDDTRTRHTGRKIFGAKYTRDPMGPPFSVNFIRANRFLQLSLACPTQPRQARMIPIDFVHAPTADKLPAKATARQVQQHRRQENQRRLTRVAATRLHRLRGRLDEDGHVNRPLWAVADGGYTNRSVLRDLPQRTIFVGRIRSDAKLYALPEPNSKGRRRIYGQQLPTPEQIRQDDAIPWQNITAAACGKTHNFRVKTVAKLRWRASGKCDLRLIVIAPLRYQLSARHRPLYRQPAYLICTHPDASLEEILQAYLWRWDIEVNFRDEKSLLGIGEAKVRHPDSVNNVPAVGVAAYGLLMLAGLRLSAEGKLQERLPPPKWRKHPSQRVCVSQLISHLRHELWHEELRKTNFATSHASAPKSQNHQPDLHSSLFYAVASG